MKSIRFKEAVTLLLIMLIILGTAVIKFGLFDFSVHVLCPPKDEKVSSYGRRGRGYLRR